MGGAVRDEIMGIKTKDVDFAVEAHSFEVMKLGLEVRGFKIFESRPEYLTIRAQVPPSEDSLYKRTKVADFVLCRKDGPTADGRRPEYVEPGGILDDLARRDFTVNAIAKDPVTHEYIDPHNGQADIKNKILRFVGNPMTRIQEDGLRVIRGYRFQVTKQLSVALSTDAALRSPEAAKMLAGVSIERVNDELKKMFDFDMRASLYLINQWPSYLLDAVFRDGLRLVPTLKQV